VCVLLVSPWVSIWKRSLSGNFWRVVLWVVSDLCIVGTGTDPVTRSSALIPSMACSTS